MGHCKMNCILDVLHRRSEDFQMEESTQNVGAGDRTWAMSWKSTTSKFMDSFCHKSPENILGYGQQSLLYLLDSAMFKPQQP